MPIYDPYAGGGFIPTPEQIAQARLYGIDLTNTGAQPPQQPSQPPLQPNQPPQFNQNQIEQARLYGIDLTKPTSAPVPTPVPIPTPVTPQSVMSQPVAPITQKPAQQSVTQSIGQVSTQKVETIGQGTIGGTPQKVETLKTEIMQSPTKIESLQGGMMVGFGGNVASSDEGATETITINGKEYGVGKPLAGDYLYYDPATDGIVAGVYVQAKIDVFAQPSQQTTDLINQIMQKTGATMDEAQQLVNQWVNANGEIHNALLNKYPELNTLLQNNVAGETWKDFKNGVPMVATQEKTDNSGKPLGVYEETVVILNPKLASDISQMPPEQQLNAMQENGIYPKSWKYINITNADGEKVSGILKTTQQQLDAVKILQDAGAIDDKGNLSIQKAIENGITDTQVILDAGYSLTGFITQADIESMQKYGTQGVLPSVAQSLTQIELKDKSVISKDLYNAVKDNDPKGFEILDGSGGYGDYKVYIQRKIDDIKDKSVTTINDIVNNNNIGIKDINNLSVSEISDIIKGGIKRGITDIAQQLVDSGQNLDSIQTAMNIITQEITQNREILSAIPTFIPDKELYQTANAKWDGGIWYVRDNAGAWRIAEPYEEPKDTGKYLKSAYYKGDVNSAVDVLQSVSILTPELSSKIKNGELLVAGDGNLYPASSFRVTNNGEAITLKEYNDLPEEWKPIVDSYGLAGLSAREKSGDLPYPDMSKWAKPAWFVMPWSKEGKERISDFKQYVNTLTSNMENRAVNQQRQMEGGILPSYINEAVGAGVIATIAMPLSMVVLPLDLASAGLKAPVVAYETAKSMLWDMPINSVKDIVGAIKNPQAVTSLELGNAIVSLGASVFMFLPLIKGTIGLGSRIIKPLTKEMSLDTLAFQNDVGRQPVTSEMNAVKVRAYTEAAEMITGGYEKPIVIGEGTTQLRVTRVGDYTVVKDLSGNTIATISKSELANTSARIAKDSYDVGYNLRQVYNTAKSTIPKIGDSISIAIASAKVYITDIPLLLQSAYSMAKSLGTKAGDEIAFTIAGMKILASDTPILLGKIYEQAKNLGTKAGDELAFAIADAKVQISKVPVLLDEAGELAKSLGTKAGDELSFAIADVKVQLSKAPIISKELYELSEKAITDVRDASLRGISKSLLDTEIVITKAVNNIKELPQDVMKELSLKLLELDSLILKVKDNAGLLTEQALKEISLKILETEKSIGNALKYVKDNAIKLEDETLRQLSSMLLETADDINRLKVLSVKVAGNLADSVGFTIAGTKAQLGKVPVLLDEAGKLAKSIRTKTGDDISTAMSTAKIYISDVPVVMKSAYSMAKALGTKVGDEIAFTIADVKILASDAPILLDKAYELAKGIGTKAGDELAFTIAGIKAQVGKIPVLFDKSIDTAKSIGSKTGDSVAFSIAEVKTQLSKIPIIADIIAENAADSISYTLAGTKAQLGKVPVLLDEAGNLAKNLGTKAGDELAFTITEIKVQLSKLPIEAEIIEKIVKDGISNISDETLRKVSKGLLDSQEVVNKSIQSLKIVAENAKKLPGQVGDEIAFKITDSVELTGRLAEYTKQLSIDTGKIIAGLPSEAVAGVRGAYYKIGDVLGQYTGEFKSGWEDAASGKPRAETFVDALKQQRKFMENYRSIGYAQQIAQAQNRYDKALSQDEKEQLKSYIEQLTNLKDKDEAIYSEIDKSELPITREVGSGNSKLTISKVGHDVVIKDIDGKVISHVSPMQRFVPDVLYSSTDDALAVESALELGKFTVDVTKGQHGGFQYFSQQPATSFGTKAIIALRTSGMDVKYFPDYIYDIKDLAERRNAIFKLNMDGKLEKGIYPVFKTYGTPETIEYEWVVSGGTEYTPIIKNEKPVVFRTKLPNVEEATPIYWFEMEGAKQLGLGVPTTWERYKSELYAGTVQKLRELAKPPKNIEFSITGRSGGAWSRFTPLEVKTVEAKISKFGNDISLAVGREAVNILEREKAGARIISELNKDKAPVARIEPKLSDAENVPVKAGTIILNRLSKESSHRLYGSFVDWLRNPRADLPKDLDIAVKNSVKFAQELAEELKQAGLDVKTREPKNVAARGLTIEIKKADGTWETLTDVRELSDHMQQYHYGLKAQKPEEVSIEGKKINIDPLGEQITRRGESIMRSGVIESMDKITRQKDVDKFKTDVEYLIDKSNRLDAQKQALRKDLDTFLEGYTKDTEGKVKETSISGLKGKVKARESLPEDVIKKQSDKAIEELTDEQINKARNEADIKAKDRASKGEDYEKVYAEEFDRALEEPYVVNLQRLLLPLGIDLTVEEITNNITGERELLREYVTQPQERIGERGIVSDREKAIAREPGKEPIPERREEVIAKTDKEMTEAIKTEDRKEPLPKEETLEPVREATREIQRETKEQPREEITKESVRKEKPAEEPRPYEPRPYEPVVTRFPTKPVEGIKFPQEPFDKKRIMEVYKGKIAWKQGKLRQGKNLKEQWYIVSPPYDKVDDVVRQFSRPTNAYVVSGLGSAYATVQNLGYTPRVLLNMDFGMFDLTLQTPKSKGDKPALKFQYDYANTRQPINVKDIKTVTML